MLDLSVAKSRKKKKVRLAYSIRKRKGSRWILFTKRNRQGMGKGLVPELEDLIVKVMVDAIVCLGWEIAVPKDKNVGYIVAGERKYLKEIMKAYEPSSKGK